MFLIRFRQQMQQMAKFFRRCGGEHGNVSVLFAFATFVLVLASGVAVDFGRLTVARTSLSAAADAAVLQVGSSSLEKQGEMLSLAGVAMQQNFDQAEHGELVRLNLDYKDSVIILSATARFKTSFMSMVGIPSVDVPVSAEVTRSGNNIEVSLVLDATGSMKGARIAALKIAAKDFINAVVWEKQTLFYSKAAIVPYSMGVNVGALADIVRGTVAGGTCSAPGCQFYRFRNQFRNNKSFAVSTCVSERIGQEAYTDASALTYPVGFNYPSPNNPCIQHELIPLTANRTRLAALIDQLDGSGSTASQVGVAWGWYVLSRDFGIWNGANQPAAYGTKNVKKITVIMTDGEFNSSYCKGVIAKSSTHGSGADEDKIDCNAPNGSAISQVQKLCDAMKKKGIVIYTVGFDIEKLEIVKQTLTDCATSPSNAYLAATSDQLSTAFREIGRKVTGMRLSK